jgi:ferritin
VQSALTWETEVTGQLRRLMDIAVAENDYLAHTFLQWFIDEQLEEFRKMDQLQSVIRLAGEKNLLMVEAYLVHNDRLARLAHALEVVRSIQIAPSLYGVRNRLLICRLRVFS